MGRKKVRQRGNEGGRGRERKGRNEEKSLEIQEDTFRTVRQSSYIFF